MNPFQGQTNIRNGYCGMHFIRCSVLVQSTSKGQSKKYPDRLSSRKAPLVLMNAVDDSPFTLTTAVPDKCRHLTQFYKFYTTIQLDDRGQLAIREQSCGRERCSKRLEKHLPPLRSDLGNL